MNIGYTIPGARYRMQGGAGQSFPQKPMVPLEVSLAVYDVSEKEVKSFNLESCILNCESSIIWFCDDDEVRKLPAGIYFVYLETKDYKQVERQYY